jgi:hypothetical protein
MARLEDIGGPKAHNNFPHGWAMASNTPLRRYKQNTHGGGIRDLFIVSWPRGIRARRVAPSVLPRLRHPTGVHPGIGIHPTSAALVARRASVTI